LKAPCHAVEACFESVETLADLDIEQGNVRHGG
jgi:hypothetical protein